MLPRNSSNRCEVFAHTHPEFPTDPSKWEPLFTPECAALSGGDCEKCERLDRDHGHLNMVAWWTAKFAEELFPTGSEDAKAARQWGYLAGLWHDLGKFSDEFQQLLRGERVRGSPRAHRVSYECLRPSAIAALISSALRNLFILARDSVVAAIASRIRSCAACTLSVSRPVAPTAIAKSATICSSSVRPFLRARFFSAAWRSSGIVIAAMRESMTFSSPPLNIPLHMPHGRISGIRAAFVTPKSPEIDRKIR